MWRIVRMSDKIHYCPQCGSSNVMAGYEVHGPVIVLMARCNDCGVMKQSMVPIKRR